MLTDSQRSFTITPSGPFSLAEAATFGFGQRDGQGWDGCMRLAFCVDGYQEPTRLALTASRGALDLRGADVPAGRP